MMMIVAHHYVVHSGVDYGSGPIMNHPHAANSIFLALLGAWGKTGINCFLMITGYFMCTSQITLKKFIKLFLQIFFYNIAIYLIFLAAGYEHVGVIRVAFLFPIWVIDTNFSSCFLVFYLTIPFWNILVQHMTKRQHELLILLFLVCYTGLGSLPTFKISYNYATWFGIIYILASYIRLYPQPLFERTNLWGWLTLVTLLLAMVSIVGMLCLYRPICRNFFVSDCNRIFAVIVAVCSFLWFKNMDIKHSKIINSMGGATFGVLLIHDNSAMRKWLWKDTVDVIGHYTLPLCRFAFFSIGVIFVIFVTCNLIDQLRIATIEKWFFNWYDKHIGNKINSKIGSNR